MARVRGAKAVRQAIRRAPREVRDEALVEVRKSTKSMYQDARVRFNTASAYAPFWHGGVGMRNITGTVRRYYRWSVSEKALVGRVGLISALANNRAFYLRFFLYGTENQPARDVHGDAFEKEREPYITNQTRALSRALSKVGFTPK